jgi:hypothetical protein
MMAAAEPKDMMAGPQASLPLLPFSIPSRVPRSVETMFPNSDGPRTSDQGPIKMHLVGPCQTPGVHDRQFYCIVRRSEISNIPPKRRAMQMHRGRKIRLEDKADYKYIVVRDDIAPRLVQV